MRMFLLRLLPAALVLAAVLHLPLTPRAAAQLKDRPAADKPPADKPPAAPPVAAKPATIAQPNDEALLKSAHLGVDGHALLGFFKKRVPPTEAASEVGRLVGDLIKQLGDKDEKVQFKAAGELVALGPSAIAGLRQTANGVEDKAVAARAKQCLGHIEGTPGANLVRAATRMLADKKPDGAAEALLDYLPFSDGDAVTAEVETTLGIVGFQDGKADPALLKALAAKHPAVRAAAVDVLCQTGGSTYFPKVRPLLKDEKPVVRLRTALCLAAANDMEAVPVLIENLGDLQPPQFKQAEEVLSDIAGDYAIKAPQGNDVVARKLRRELWQAWWKSLDGKVIIEEMHSRTLSDADLEKAKALLKQLGDKDVKVRDTASTDLVALGPPVLPLLRQLNTPPGSVQVQAAGKCVQLIEKDTPNPLPAAAPRLLVLHRPEKTLDTLLNYLPFAENDSVAGQIVDLIASTGFKDGKPEAVLLAALEDKVAARRAAAVVALGLEGGDDQKPALRKMLKDAEPEVRLRAAQALIGLKEKEAVPELINLIPDLPPDLAWEAEDLLARMAKDKNPNVPFGADAAAHGKCKDAWALWWKDNGDKVDLLRTDPRNRMLGYTLIIEGTTMQANRQGRVTELDAGGRVRFQIDGLAFPTDAQVVGGDRVLIAEQNGNRVTERDLTGKIVWEKQGVGQPFVVRRERNGNTFIGCRNQLLEVDRGGKEVVNVQRFNEYILAATKLRDGQIAYMNNQGMYYRLDATGKELKNLRVPFNPQFGINWAEILPNDHVLITAQAAQKITEFDGDGKQVWEATIQASGGPTRMANGHTLVPTLGNSRIVELDRSGKPVWEFKEATYRPFRVTRR